MIDKRSDRGFDFNTQYSRVGILHRWRLFTYGQQIGEGTEKTSQLARKASRECKSEYKTRHIKNEDS